MIYEETQPRQPMTECYHSSLSHRQIGSSLTTHIQLNFVVGLIGLVCMLIAIYFQ